VTDVPQRDWLLEMAELEVNVPPFAVVSLSVSALHVLIIRRELETKIVEAATSSLLQSLLEIRHSRFSYTSKKFLPLYNTAKIITRNSSGDEIANVNFLYDDIVHTVKIQYRLLHFKSRLACIRDSRMGFFMD